MNTDEKLIPLSEEDTAQVSGGGICGYNDDGTVQNGFVGTADPNWQKKPTLWIAPDGNDPLCEQPPIPGQGICGGFSEGGKNDHVLQWQSFNIDGGSPHEPPCGMLP